MCSLLLLMGVFLLTGNAFAKGQILVERIEPPFWWIGMHNSQLQLMVHGKDISALTVKIPSQNLSFISVETTDNPNYLFLNLSIPNNAKAGVYDIEFYSGKNKVYSHHYHLKSRQPGSAQREGFSSKDVIYLITPDRFANGNTKNDQVEGLQEGVNRSDVDGRHGGDIQGVVNHLEYIQQMGFTQLWLNPVLENNHPRSTYHGYSTTDYYKIDPRFGTNELYRDLARQSKQKNIGLIKDVILNHIGTEHWWMTDLPSSDWINSSKEYVETSHRRESLHDPHGTQEDIEAFASGWFVPTMADLNQRNPLVANYLIQNCIWWTEYAELSGLRVDTYSYSDKAFLASFTQRLMSEYPNYNIVAEEWSNSPIIVSYWQRGKQTHDNYHSELPSLMDFPLQNTMVKGLLEKETWSDGLRKLYEILASDFVYPDSNNLVVFPDNHDMARIHTQLGHDQRLTKIAVAMIATIRGIPQYFYGTEILMDNPDSDAHGVIRTDFPGGWSMDNANAFTGQGLSNEQSAMQHFTKNLLNWRKNSEAVKRGKLTHYSPENGIYVYFRHTQKDKVMVIINKGNEDKELDTARFTSLLSEKDKKQKATDILTKQAIDLAISIDMPAKSIRIIQL